MVQTRNADIEITNTELQRLEVNLRNLLEQQRKQVTETSNSISSNIAKNVQAIANFKWSYR